MNPAFTDKVPGNRTLYCDRYWKYTTCCFCSSFVPSPEVIQTLTSFEVGCHTNVLIEEAGKGK